MEENKKGKTMKYIVTVLVVLGLLSVLLYAMDKYGKKAPTTIPSIANEIIKAEDLEKCDSIDDETYPTVCRNNIYLNKATRTGDVSLCANMDGKMITQAICEMQVVNQASVAKEDISICDGASDQDVRASCRASFYTALAIKKDDNSVCATAPDKTGRDFCYNTLALQGINPLEFLQGGADCASFRGDAAGDCRAIQEDPNTGCAGVSSQSFTVFCQYMGGVLPQLPQIPGGI